MDLNSVFQFNMPKIQTDLQIEWIVPNDLKYFDGHFPGNPIMPGIAIVDANAHLIQNHFLKNKPTHQLRKLVSSKFLQPVYPGMKINICITAKENEYNCEWTEVDTKNELSYMKLVFSTADETEI